MSNEPEFKLYQEQMVQRGLHIAAKTFFILGGLSVAATFVLWFLAAAWWDRRFGVAGIVAGMLTAVMFIASYIATEAQE